MEDFFSYQNLCYVFCLFIGLIYWLKGAESFVFSRIRNDSYYFMFWALCFFMGAYAFNIALSWFGSWEMTNGPQLHGNIVAVTSVVIYLSLISHHIELSRKFRLFSQTFLTLFVIVSCADFVSFLSSGNSFLTGNEIFENRTLFSQRFSHGGISVLTSTGEAFFGIQGIFIFGLYSILLYSMVRQNKKDSLIKAGFILNIVFLINDMGTGLISSPYHFPMFFLAFLPEVWRFSREVKLRDQEKISELNSQVDQLERISSLGFSNAAMAHEMKNILGIIKGNASILQKKFEIPNGSEKYYESINHSIQLAQRNIETFHNIAKNTNERRNDDILLSDLFNNLHAVFLHLEKEFEIRFEIDQKEVSTHCNLSDSLTLFTNLVKNASEAVKDLNQYDKWIKIQWNLDEPSGQICVSIINGGEKWTPKIDPFSGSIQSTKSSSGGSGLGLKIVSRICNDNGFEISLDSSAEFTKIDVNFPASSIVQIQNAS